MNPERMWHLIADLVYSYAVAGETEQAIASLVQALSSHPMWIPNALFDERTELLRDHPGFKEATVLPQEDGPAHFNAAVVAFEFGEVARAVEWLSHTFELAAEDGSLPFLIEALRDDQSVQPYLAHSRVAALLDQHSAGGPPRTPAQCLTMDGCGDRMV